MGTSTLPHSSSMSSSDQPATETKPAEGVQEKPSISTAATTTADTVVENVERYISSISCKTFLLICLFLSFFIRIFSDSAPVDDAKGHEIGQEDEEDAIDDILEEMYESPFILIVLLCLLNFNHSGWDARGPRMNTTAVKVKGNVKR